MTDDDLERRLRESLRREAARVTPRNRLDEIRAIAGKSEPAQPRPRWYVPAAAAASVALIAGIVWAAGSLPGQRTTAPPATATTPTASATRTASPTQTSSTSAPSTSAGATTAATVTAVPTYVIGPNGDSPRLGLYRFFVATPVPKGATDAQRARTALALALDAQGLEGEGLVSAWGGTRLGPVSVTADGIQVTMAGRGPQSTTGELARLGVQQLVWTAQAAVGRGNLPVSFRLSDGSTAMFSRFPVNRTYTRPPASRQYLDLAGIWVETPARGQVIPAGKHVVATGSACTFEGTLQYELIGPTGRAEGALKASSGCPTRGTWKVDLGVLAPGDYTLQAFELSAQGGQSLTALTSRSFTVR